MNDDELRQLLEELHTKIENTDSVDEKGSELLSHVNADIHSLLQRTGHERSLRESSLHSGSWEDSIRHFEVTHPNLTAAISHLLDILNNAGI
jgi:hypothetical protein